MCVVGSSNISDEYAGDRFGNSFFMDLNLYCENLLGSQFADFMRRVLSTTDEGASHLKSIMRELKWLGEQYPDSPIPFQWMNSVSLQPANRQLFNTPKPNLHSFQLELSIPP